MDAKDTVLIVDDSRVSRMMISSIVKDQHPDWPIVEACNGDDALEKSKNEQNLKLIILDFNMPGMNGLELAVHLREAHPESHITLLTANVQNSAKAKAAEIGVAFAAKPITEDRIVEILSAVA